MIQTQLLRLDPPYQIISAKGYVGIQVATLIMSEEKDLSHGSFGHVSSYIEHHCYPVVNYGLKQGLDEQLKYNNSTLDEYEKYTNRRRMQPEGAVWSGIEVKDVRVLGLAGANNYPVDLDCFVYLIPTVWGYDPNLHVWDENSTSRIFDLYQGLGNVGLQTPILAGLPMSQKNSYPIKLTLEQTPTADGYYVKVMIKEDYNYALSGLPDESIYFRCLISPSSSDSIRNCASTIAEALNGIAHFLPTTNLIIECTEPRPEFSEAMKKLTFLVDEGYRNLLYPHHD